MDQRLVDIFTNQKNDRLEYKCMNIKYQGNPETKKSLEHRKNLRELRFMNQGTL